MNIYVGNLSLDVSESELRRIFMTFGDVTSVTLMNHQFYGNSQPIGFAYVDMPSRSEGEAAIDALKGRTLRHRVIDVIQALPLSDTGHQKKRGHYSVYH